MKTVKATLKFEGYCWEGLEAGIPKCPGVFITYSCDKKGDEFLVANILFARASYDLSVDVASIARDPLVCQEKANQRRIYSTFACVDDVSVAIAAASAIQYNSPMLEKGQGRFRFFRYGDVEIQVTGKWAFRVQREINLKVNDCLKALSADDYAAFRRVIRKSQPGDQVRNAIDTADDEAPHGASWISFWRSVVGHDEPKTCPNVKCQIVEHPLDGSHVVIKDDPKKIVYVMPLCKSCNRSRSEEYFSVPSGIEMIPVGEP